MPKFERKLYKRSDAHVGYLMVETMTPLHIGTGETLQRGIDFFVCGEGLRIYDPVRLFEALAYDRTEEAALEQMVEAFSRRHAGGNVDVDWVDRQNPRHKERFQQAIARRIAWKNRQGEDLLELRAFMGTGNGAALLPGSSLKGAIRGVILDYLLGKDKAPLASIAYNPSTKDAIFKPLFSPPHTPPKLQMNLDILRLLRVGDGEFPSDCTEAMLARIYNLVAWEPSERKWGTGRMDQYLEVVPAGQQCALRMELGGIMRAFLKEFARNILPDRLPLTKGPQSDIHELLQLIHQHTLAHIQREVVFWQNNAARNKPDQLIHAWADLEAKAMGEVGPDSAWIRVGQGGGYFGITGDWQHRLEPRAQDSVLALRKKHNGRDGRNAQPIFPKSRKTVRDTPLGFIRLRLVDEQTYLEFLRKQYKVTQKTEEIMAPAIDFKGRLKQRALIKGMYVEPDPTQPIQKRFRISIAGQEQVIATRCAMSIPVGTLVELEIKEIRNDKVTQVEFKKLWVS